MLLHLVLLFLLLLLLLHVVVPVLPLLQTPQVTPSARLCVALLLFPLVMAVLLLPLLSYPLNLLLALLLLPHGVQQSKVRESVNLLVARVANAHRPGAVPLGHVRQLGAATRALVAEHATTAAAVVPPARMRAEAAATNEADEAA
jgi:hypothetical protein